MRARLAVLGIGFAMAMAMAMAMAVADVAQATPHTIVYVDGAKTLIVEAAPGKTNYVTIEQDVANRRLLVTDTGDGLAAGAGCWLVGSEVRCQYKNSSPPVDRYITSVMVNLNDADDRLNVKIESGTEDTIPANLSGDAGHDVITSRTQGTINGGDGNDTLRYYTPIPGFLTFFGGDGDDTIYPTGGHQLIFGNAGEDTVDYLKNSGFYPGSGVRVTIGVGNDDGYLAVTAKDNVWSDVENVHGTEYNDFIAGTDAHDNNLYGHGGDDWLAGGLARSDECYGGPGPGDVFFDCEIAVQ